MVFSEQRLLHQRTVFRPCLMKSVQNGAVATPRPIPLQTVPTVMAHRQYFSIGEQKNLCHPVLGWFHAIGPNALN